MTELDAKGTDLIQNIINPAMNKHFHGGSDPMYINIRPSYCQTHGYWDTYIQGTFYFNEGEVAMWVSVRIYFGDSDGAVFKIGVQPGTTGAFRLDPELDSIIDQWTLLVERAATEETMADVVVALVTERIDHVYRLTADALRKRMREIDHNSREYKHTNDQRVTAHKYAFGEYKKLMKTLQVKR
jgi:hypothetical protein